MLEFDSLVCVCLFCFLFLFLFLNIAAKMSSYFLGLGELLDEVRPWFTNGGRDVAECSLPYYVSGRSKQ